MEENNSPVFNIKTASEDSSLSKKGYTFCVYSQSGIGKTTLASTFPEKMGQCRYYIALLLY